MKNEFLSKVEDNAAIRAWSERLQSERGNSLAEGYVSELQDFTRINIVQNELQELRDIWASWDEGIKQLFYQSYDDISYLLDIRVDKHLFRALVQFWNSAYKCFTFGEVDLVPTMEEYTTLLRCPKIQLMSISGMSEPWVTARIPQKGDSKCIPWENLRDLILTHLDERKRVNIFDLSIYGLVIFLKALRHVDEAVIDLFDRLEKGITSVPAILVDKVSYRVFSEGYSPLKEEAAIQRREDILEEKWMDILQNLKEGDIEWRAYWMVPDESMYRCGNFDWVPLLGIWGATEYTPLIALRQYKSRQFVPTTYGLAQSEFSRLKRLAVGSMVTAEYSEWFKKRINDNIPRPSLENARPIGEQLQVAPSELEIIRQDFEKKSLELRKKIEQLEEEKMHLRLDAEV
ncbi:uncharacterized protein [Gossypium hirsutum]|uniref:DUF7745 domain-containing protein n=1 Tax=Gossypium hirsutum TaxID=3635 RepID=A0A1U8NG77_GOSHI|nr:uncharacterized protein LOC107948042 [Gossypium hirsutum]